MKNFSYIALVALAAWGFTSCDEYTLPNPPAQSNEQEAAFSQDNVTVTSEWSGTLVLTNYTAGIPMCVVNADYLPEGYTIKVTAQMAANSSFSDYAEFPCYVFENDDPELQPEGEFIIRADQAEVEAAFIQIHGKNPEPKSVVVRYMVYTVNGNTVYRVGSNSTYFATSSTTMTPVGPGHLVYPENYFVTNAGGWNKDAAVLMTQANPGDQYDNPDFYVEFATADKGVQYKVVPNTTFKDDFFDGYAPTTPSAMEGTMDWFNGTSKTGVIEYPGRYKLSANMLELTYNISYNFPTLYVASAANKDEATMMQLPTDNRTYFRGVAVLANNFWLTGTPSTPEIGFSNAASTDGDEDFAGKLLYNDNASQTAMIVDARKALYMVIANISDNKWTATQIKNLGAVGDFQGWDPASAPKFSHSDDFLTWTIKGLELNGEEFKICGNGGWGINFGGSPDNLVVDGGNFSNYGGAGKYDITLDFSKLPYTATFTKL